MLYSSNISNDNSIPITVQFQVNTTVEKSWQKKCSELPEPLGTNSSFDRRMVDQPTHSITPAGDGEF